MKNWVVRVVLCASTLVFGGVASAATVVFNQDFDTDSVGWLDFGGTVTQVASGGGTLGVASASGSAGHAEVAIGPNTGNGGFTRFGAYSSVWPGKIVQSLDVYIDPNAGNVGDGWYLDNAVNDTSGNWLEAGGVGALKATDGFWWVTADGDGGAYPGLSSGGAGLKVTNADWYTIVSEWVANADGLTVDRNTFILDSGGTQLYSQSNLQQVSLAQIGGNRYGWIAANSPTSMTLAIDNSSLEVGVMTVVPLPASAWMGLSLLGGLGVIRRIKKH